MSATAPGPGRYDLTRTQLGELLHDEPRYRLDQLWHGLYARGAALEELSNVPKALKAHPEVELWADDPAARADLDAFCAATGYALVASDDAPGLLRAVVRRR